MKTPSFFKLAASTVARLEAAQAYSERLGQKMTKTDLVERAIQMLATSDDEVRGKSAFREQPVPPLLQAYRAWKVEDVLTRGQYLHLAQSAHTLYKRHSGLINPKYLVDVIKAAQAVVGLRRQKSVVFDYEQLDSYYYGCLYERRSTLSDSFAASIERVQQTDFAAAAELPVRVLVAALRDEPPVDDRLLNNALQPFHESLFRLAIRCYWLETGKHFLDPDVDEPSPANYWADYYRSKDFGSQDLRLEWGADHRTTGLKLKAEVGESAAVYEFHTFIDVTDFLCLSNNLILGGPGGERGALLFARSSDLDCDDRVEFKVGLRGSRMGFKLSNLALRSVLDCVTELQSDDDFVVSYKSLAEIYGDV